MNTSETTTSQATPSVAGLPLDLGAAVAATGRLAAAVRADQLDDPTPCPGMNVAGMLAHTIGFSTAFRDGAAKASGPSTETPPGQLSLSEDWPEQLPLLLLQLAEAWRDPAAWTGETTVGGVTMPAPQMAAFANNELIVHAWDLAVATGQLYDPPAANLEAAWRLVSAMTEKPAARAGLFGPVVAVPENAPLLDRLVGGAGRDPHWSSLST